ncbi:MAG: excinuclease ABC subunit UvrA [Planctomycetota bacterium]|nr:MAG: excinuclease ABC subunit UvrA [Planctomycetota bacterium]
MAGKRVKKKNAGGDFLSALKIVGARVHNLKNINLDIPKNKFVVFTGVSGSGKSSLAFDTLFAEGQRRYIESLSSYARQFLDRMEKPPYDHIYGLSPTISIDQKSVSRNPRSTVGTITEIYDYLRVFFARLGIQHCYECGQKVGSGTADSFIGAILDIEKGREIWILAPIVVKRKGEHRDVIADLKSKGFVRLRVNGVLTRSDDVARLEKNKKHTIEVVVDRLKTGRLNRKRLADSVETAVRLGRGQASIYIAGSRRELRFAEKRVCTKCNISYPEMEPNLLSYNSPLGMCVACNGLGLVYEFDPKLIFPDGEASLLEWTYSFKGFSSRYMRAIAKALRINVQVPVKSLPKKARRELLYGSKSKELSIRWSSERFSGVFRGAYEGIIPMLRRRITQTTSEGSRRYYMSLMSNRPCSKCGGSRLRPEARSITVNRKSIVDISTMSIQEALGFFENLKLNGWKKTVGSELVKEIKGRLKFLNNVGLSYLNLNRNAPTLSAGESQRIRLASQIGSELTGVLYILDEPTIGLHQRDNTRLLSALKHLRDIGNTVIVVEHDPETINTSDHIIDFGPGAGIQGGRIVATGSPAQIKRSAKSLTGRYLAGKESIPVPKTRRNHPDGWIKIIGARENNLKNIRVGIPLGEFVVVTGVSGAGKSTLINQTLYPALANELHNSSRKSGKHKAITGVDRIDKLININQSPIGRTSRSNSATYTKVFDLIRQLFSRLPDARMAGYKPGRFSFNVRGGRCDNCDGDGYITVPMHFLPDVYVKCEVCGGRRFNEATLEVKYRDHSIADVLGLSVSEAMKLFENQPKILKILKTLDDVGMGYVRLGQPSPTLSGGEAQRIKLSRELAKRSTGRTLYILDEPSTGLHLDDIKKLLNVLQRLVDAGNTVVVIEHNLDIIKVADYIIDLGPEGGEEGGRVVATGTPEEVVRVKNSHTGKFLRKVLNSK